MSAEAATLKLTGIPLDKREKLIAQLSPRLDFIKSRPPSSWRADDAAFFLKRLLIRTGHAEADVQWELPGGNTILLKATPGPRYLYGKISTTKSIPLTAEELRSYFLQPLVEAETVNEDSAPYIAEYNQLGADNVHNLLKSRGYWQSTVKITRTLVNRTTKRTGIMLDIQPGALYKVAMPTFRGASPQEISVFTEKIQPFIGKTADTETLGKVRNTVENFYRDRGYEFLSIKVIPRHSNASTYLTFNIDRGKIYEVNDIKILGNKHTQSRRIRRYFDGLKHKPYSREEANAALSQLLSTGAFTRATLRTVPDDVGALDIAVDVKEAKARSLRSYLGVGSYEGFILGSSYTDLNFHGKLLRLNLRGEYSGRGFLGEASITEPHFAGEPVKLNLRGFLLQRIYEGYDKKEAGIEAALLWSPAEHLSSRVYAGASQVAASTTSLTPAELGPENYTNLRVGIQQTVDYRDSPILPTKGFYGSALLEYGRISGDASTGYYRGQLDLSYRVPVYQRHNLMARFSSGAIKPSNSGSLPIDLRLFSGGADSVRSYDSRELGPRSISDDPLGGQAFWNASLQYTHAVNDPIKAVVFFDAGQVYSNFSDWGFSDPNLAVGLGLKIDLPIGPVRLEYGHNINPKNGEPSGTLHFAIGTTF